MIYYYHNGVFGVFATITARSRLRALRLQRCGEGPVDKWPLGASEGSGVDCRFDGLARPSREEPFTTNYGYLCNPIDCKYDSVGADNGGKCLGECDARLIDARGVAGSLCYGNIFERV